MGRHGRRSARELGPALVVGAAAACERVKALAVGRHSRRSVRAHRPTLVVGAAASEECVQAALVHAHQLQPVQRLRIRPCMAPRQL